jgi:HEPN domain-containing protein
MAPEALRWLAVAGQDLKAVRNNIHGPDPALDIAAYHCQQAAEKICKAALITRGIDPPRWHDLDSLITLLGATHPLAAPLAPLAGLTPYGIAFRYPVPDPEALPPIPTAEELADWLTVLEDARAAVGKAAQDSG